MKYVRFGIASALILSPTLAFAAAPKTFQELANMLVILMNNATAVLVVLGLVVYFYGISTNILKISEHGSEKLKAYFFWGILVLFVMVSVWGILQILQNTLFGGDQFAPNTGVNAVGQSSPFTAPTFSE